MCNWPALLQAYARAARAKRRRSAVAALDHRIADRLLELQRELLDGDYRPGRYTHFVIHEPKRRRISAARFRDRIVQHPGNRGWTCPRVRRACCLARRDEAAGPPPATRSNAARRRASRAIGHVADPPGGSAQKDRICHSCARFHTGPRAVNCGFQDLALCAIIEPRFERVFIADSYANRVGKGTHRAIARLQHFARCHRYVLRADIRQHFASIDHAILLDGLTRKVPEPDLIALIEHILAGGRDALRHEYDMVWFAGDDLLAQCRPRGLPIGNLTSQFWSNCYLHPFDLFVKRELGCRAYLRYVDDFALFAEDKATLWAWKAAIRERLASLRLTLHEGSTQVAPSAAGTPWLGQVIYPTRRRLKARKLRFARRRLEARYRAYCAGEISFAEFDASVRGWLAHAAHADSWGLRRDVLAPFVLAPGDVPGRPRRR